jgi:23S rRNA (uracil-5-)-methyltransferase RumA
MENSSSLVIGNKIQVEIRRQGINGEGIGYHNKLAVFVPGAILREIVMVEITDLKPGYALGKIDSLVQESVRRIVPPCPFYEKCGGCHMLHIAYSEQLKIKQSILKQSLKRYTELNVDRLDIRRTLGMKENFGYRNKSQMPFKNTNLGLSLGLYEANSNRFVAVDTCMVQDPVVNEANLIALKILSDHHLMAADSMNPEGILLNLVTRYVQSTDSLQITLIVSAFRPVLNQIAVQILNKIPRVKGVFCSVNKQHNVLMFGKTVECLAGDRYVTEKIGDLTLKLSPEAFHQLNTAQMNVLYNEILKACNLKGTETVIDAFCGIGISTLQMAKRSRFVFGIDYSDSSIKDAIANAVENQIKNVAFLTERVEKALPELLAKPQKPDILVCDPPRSGLEDPVIDALLSSRIPKIVYVSCNPSTLAKNLARLVSQYEVAFIQPIDMFPHTSNVESVVCLERKKADL